MAQKKETVIENVEETLIEEKLNEKANELVTIRLFRDGGKYKDDLFVAVNGRRWLIQRGVDVQVPRYVADFLDSMQKQDVETSQMIKRETENSKVIHSM